MAEYSRKFGSLYPLSPIPLGTHKDIDDSVISLVNQFNTLMESGNRQEAANLYAKNKNILKKYIIDMEYINYLEEEIYNVGIKAISQFNTIQSPSLPTIDQDDGCYWIQEY